MSFKRLIVAFIVLPILVCYMIYLPIEFFFLLIFVLSMIALFEFYSMCKMPPILLIAGLLSGGTIFFMKFFSPEKLLEVMFLTLFILMSMRLFLMSTTSGSLKTIGQLVLGIFYIPGFAIFIPLLRRDFGLELTFLLLTSTWFADASAYYIGKSLGKRKLYQTVSPNKTLEGAIGSLLGGSLGAVIIKIIYPMIELTTTKIILTGIMIGMSAILGDLIESMFKRDAGIKDSSHLIPGHGGLLDKMDSFLVTGPVLYFLCQF